MWHRLHAVEHYVQDGLLHQVGIHLYAQRIGAEFALYGDAVLFGVGRSQHDHILQQPAQVDFLEMQITWSSEIHQNLDHPVQTVNLIADDVHVTACVGIDLLQLGLQ